MSRRNWRFWRGLGVVERRRSKMLKLSEGLKRLARDGLLAGIVGTGALALSAAPVAAAHMGGFHGGGIHGGSFHGGGFHGGGFHGGAFHGGFHGHPMAFNRGFRGGFGH